MDASSLFASARPFLSRASCYVRNAVTDDVRYVSENARHSDIQEARALRVELEDGLLRSHLNSPRLSAAFIGPSGEPCAVFGVAESVPFALRGYKHNISPVWLIATKEFDEIIRAHPRLVYSVGRLVVAAMLAHYPALGNVVPISLLPRRENMLNRLGARWLQASENLAFFLISKE